MAEREEHDEALLLLLLALRRLITGEWLTFYVRSARRRKGLWRRVETEARRTERRARLAYQDQISSLDTDDGTGTTRLKASASRALVAERAIREEYMRPMRENGSIHRVTMKEMRQAHLEGADQVASHQDDLAGMSETVGLEAETARLQLGARDARGARSGELSSWAMRRDLELLATNSAHRAALSLHGAAQGQRLSSALRTARPATRVNRRSLSNSTVSSARATQRSSVYRAATAAAIFGAWWGLRPYPGGTAATQAFTADEWVASAASRTAGDAWQPGNPVSGWGLHVGSRTFFAPELEDDLLTGVARGLLVAEPSLATELRVTGTVSMSTLGGAAVEYAGKGVRSINELLSAISAKVSTDRRRVPVIVAPGKNRIRATIVGVYGKGATRQYAIDAGRNQGVELGQRFEVYSPLGPTRGDRKSVIAITALYPETATGFVTVYDATAPELLDRVYLG